MISSRGVLVSGAPFIHDSRTMAHDTWIVSLLLLPVLALETLLTGWGTLAGALAAILAALAADAIQSVLRHRFELDDGSAFLTGLLIALTLPPGAPVYAPIGASLFAILAVKGAFGGLGNNWMNPALGGVAFAWLDWGSAITATGHERGIAMSPPFVQGLPSLISNFDDRLTSLFNGLIFQPLGARMPSGYFATMLGVGPGGTAGLPVGLVLAASAALIGFRIIRWQIPAAMIAFFVGPVWLFGGVSASGMFAGDALGLSLSGPLLLVAFFMATDPVTSPSRTLDTLIFGAGCGLIAFFFVQFGAPSFAPLLGVLFMNSLTPLIEGIGTRRAKMEGA